MSDLVERMRGFEEDHAPDGWPAIRMREVSELCDMIDAAKARINALARRPAGEMREMLRAMQAGEMTISRGVELLEMWLAGNYSDDQLPPVDNTLGDDEFPMEIIKKQSAMIEKMSSALESCCKGDYSTGHVIHPSFDETAVNEALAAYEEWKK